MFGEILGQHRDSTGCAFGTFLAHLTHATMRMWLYRWG
jgi:hypothetical protein